ncbi:MAG: DUF2955 domain-containing protein [Pseudomonadota bacterium]
MDKAQAQEIQSAASRHALRIALAATLAFTIAELAKWEFSFLAPMLAIQVLAASRNAPGFKQGIAIPLVILIATSLALGIATLTTLTPVVLLLLVSLVICLSFYAQRRGAPNAVMLLIQIAFCCIPVIHAISFDLAFLFMTALIQGSIAAIVTIWIVYWLLPSPPIRAGAVPPSVPPSPEPAVAARIALSDTLILLPILVAFIMHGDINNIIVLMIALNLLRVVEPEQSGRIAVAIILGNVLGGGIAVLAYQFVVLGGSLVFFVLIVLAMGLWFGGRIVRGGPKAPVYAIAFATFLLMLGLGVSPLPSGSEELFATRIVKILLASAYVIGALSLVAQLRRLKGPASPATG